MAYGHSVTPQASQSNGTATTGFVLSLCGLILCPPVMLVGLIVSLFGLKREPKGLAIAGSIIAVVGILVWTFVIIITFSAIAAPILACMGFIEAINEEMEQGIMDDYATHPTVVEKLGGLDSVEVSHTESEDYYEFTDENYATVYHVSGPDGSGVIIQYDDWTIEEDGYEEVTLLIIDGESWELNRELVNWNDSDFGTSDPIDPFEEIEDNQ